MILRLRITPRAARDLQHIQDYLVARNPAGADKVRLRIVNALDVLCEFPFTGRPTVRSDVLMTLVTKYRYKIYYSVGDDEVQIVHIRHPARREPGADEL